MSLDQGCCKMNETSGNSVRGAQFSGIRRRESALRRPAGLPWMQADSRVEGTMASLVPPAAVRLASNSMNWEGGASDT